MKKIILFAAFAFFINYSYAQGVKFGVIGGITSANQKYSNGDDSETSSSKIGFTLGGFANISLNDKFSIQPGLNFTQKGGKEEILDNDVVATLNYLEIPINALYNASVGSGNLFVGAGPTIGLGIGGKYTVDGEEGDDNVKIFGSDEDALYKPLELGLNFVVGYRLSNGLSFALNYNLGSNISNSEDDDNKTNNRYFGIRVGYEFGGK